MNPKIIIVICIFDRFENMRRWIHAWNMCDQMGAKLVFVNNYSTGIDVNFWKDYCRIRNIGYIERPNIGYETGIIQDVILGRILENEDWEIYFSLTDDTLPMKKGFLKEYVNMVVNEDVGVACMQISGAYTPHIRTTGWCIKKETAKLLQFPFDPIDNKDKCYHFEHIGGELTLMAQILKMDKRVVQMGNIKDSSIWDTHHTNFNRWEHWHKEFPNYN